MEATSLTPDQESSFQSLQVRVLQQTSNPTFTSIPALVRILRARDFKVDDSYTMWLRWVDWREHYRPELITESDMQRHISTGKAFFKGHDKLGRPCLIVRVRNHFPSDFAAEETLRYSIYLAERACELADLSGTGQICMIYDRGGINDANQDPNLIQLVREMAEIFKDFYAERLGALYVLHISWLHWILYHAVRPTIPKKTREKLHVMRNNNGLNQYFDKDQLLEEYGSTLV